MELTKEQFLLIANLWTFFFGSAFAVPAHILLIVVARKCDDLHLRTYSTLMQIMSATVISVSVVALFSGDLLDEQVTISITTNIYIFNPHNARDSPSMVQDLVLILRGGFYLLMTFMCPLAFVFRYSVLVQAKPLSTRQILVVYALFALVAMSYGSMNVLSMTPSTEAPEHALVLQEHGINVTYFRVTANDDTVVQVVGLGMATLNIAIIVFCGVKSYMAIRRSEQMMSPGVRWLSKRLSLVFLLQALYPILFQYGPLIIMYTLLANGITFIDTSRLVLMALSLVPSIDAITFIILLPPYRNTILRWMKLLKPSIYSSFSRSVSSVQHAINGNRVGGVNNH